MSVAHKTPKFAEGFHLLPRAKPLKQQSHHNNSSTWDTSIQLDPTKSNCFLLKINNNE